jgi:YDG domain
LNAVAPGLVVAGPNFVQAAGSGTPADCTGSFALEPAESCNLSLSFTPQSAGALVSSAVFTDNALNATPPASQVISLTGVGIQTIQAQSIMFSMNAPSSATYNSTFTVAATASSGLPVAFTSSGSCTNAGATYTMTSGTGTCSVIANQAGNTSYSAATAVIQVTSATPAAQTITFTTNAPASAAYNSSFTVDASGGASGNPVTYSSAGSCSNSGAKYTMTAGTGSCSVIANQAGNTNYAPAPQVNEAVIATPLALAASVIASSKVYDGTTTATITVCTLSGVTIGDAGKVSCTANGPNTFASASPGTNIIVTAANITLSGLAAGNYLLSPTTATTTASIIYKFIGLEAPYAPPPTTFNVTRTMPLAWQYANASGAVVNSAAANPTVQISGPYPCGGTATSGAITINSAGASGYQYNSTTNTWQFNWQINGSQPGCYNIYIVSGQTGQSSGPYPIAVVSH